MITILLQECLPDHHRVVAPVHAPQNLEYTPQHPLSHAHPVVLSLHDQEVQVGHLQIGPDSRVVMAAGEAQVGAHRGVEVGVLGDIEIEAFRGVLPKSLRHLKVQR